MDVDISPIKVKYQGKVITIDIQKELTIDRNRLESQLRDIPSSYFILCSVRNTYIKRRDALARERDEAYSRAWTFLKDANPSWNNDYVSYLEHAKPLLPEDSFDFDILDMICYHADEIDLNNCNYYD